MKDLYISLTAIFANIVLLILGVISLEERRIELIEYADEYKAQGRDPFNPYLQMGFYIISLFIIGSILYSIYLYKKDKKNEKVRHSRAISILLLIGPYLLTIMIQILNTLMYPY